jgi:nicotinate-nucleotide adenylyltransferase
VSTGLIGGTFDPIHIAHLIMAEEALQQCALDRVLFVPAPRPPHKRRGNLSSFTDRLAMVRLAVTDNPRLEVTDIESRREGASYTIETVQAIRSEIGDGESIALIIGGDSLEQFLTWKDPDRLLSEVGLIVARRPGSRNDHVDARVMGSVRFLDMPLLGVSSTDIRDRVRGGRSIRYLVPENVRSYITEKNLYS